MKNSNSIYLWIKRLFNSFNNEKHCVHHILPRKKIRDLIKIIISFGFFSYVKIINSWKFGNCFFVKTCDGEELKQTTLSWHTNPHFFFFKNFVICFDLKIKIASQTVFPMKKNNNKQKIQNLWKNVTSPLQIGQLIFKCPFVLFRSSNKVTKFFPGFLP